MKSATVASRCSGLSGAMEIQVLVGPAEVLGLLPFSMGEIRFSVDSGGGAYLVHGQGAITYQETLTEAWVTYSVSFDMKGTFEGECIGEPGSEELEIITEMSGEQIVEVRADGFQGDYPWSGTHTLYLTLPLEEGAVVEGEGCAFVRHLSE